MSEHVPTAPTSVVESGRGSEEEEIIHVLSQEGQPYGSERRCCNYCGVMIWGESAPRHVDNWTDWRASPNNCGTLGGKR